MTSTAQVIVSSQRVLERASPQIGRWLGVGLGALVSLMATPCLAHDEASFFNGKTVTLYVGFAAGGSYDFYSRLIARFLPKHIPGNPNVVVQNMAGAGSLQAANFLFNSAPKDGTAIGNLTQTLAHEEAMQTPNVRYAAVKFNWLGRMTSTLQVGVASKKSNVRTIEDATQRDIPTSGTGSGSPSEGYPRLLNALAGTKYRVISGYRSSPEALLAMERGEVEAVQTSWDTLKRSKQDLLRNNEIYILYQCALERSVDLPNVPTPVDVSKTDEGRQIMAFYTRAAEVGLSLLLPPDVPAERVAALQRAYDSLMKDPDFLSEVERLQIEFQPASGPVVQKLIADTIGAPKQVIEKTAAILRPK
jgi:tripartite-type tricarboxylate transporter receptor subunit TctC